MLSISMRSLGVGAGRPPAAKKHRGNGYITEATLTAARWAFTSLAVDRLECAPRSATRAPARSRNAPASRWKYLRSALNNKGVRRDRWIGPPLPSDLGLPEAPYLPAPPFTP